MPKTAKAIIVAAIPESRSVLYTVSHRPDVDPVPAIRAAAADFLATPDGKAAYLSNIYPDTFNWGDAVLYIPTVILRRHGVTRFEQYDTCAVLTVEHDEQLASLDETTTELLKSDWLELVSEQPGAEQPRLDWQVEAPPDPADDAAANGWDKEENEEDDPDE